MSRSHAPAGGCEVFGNWYEGGMFLPDNPTLEESAGRSYKKREPVYVVEDRANSRHIGVIGDKITATVTVAAVIRFDGFYGPSFLHVSRDSAGNVIVARSSRVWANRGDTLIIKATIKGHKDWNGIAQTDVTRVKAI